ncbi:hypothetical protein PHISCL_06736 [Aspergillus sclerotialis]|uniref:Uncharacterized protein n=1 Tax=Aspergillus sclerotialis TaxID=2070753 RepID=A0A3A2ZNI1_9EURO|nr:hypothetical protein PHISCL_06736 [Aspergillus sclerotialis]
MARQYGRDNYLKTQDVEAQLVAAGIFDMKRAFFNLILILEKKLDPINNEEEPEIFELFEPDFDIPAIFYWIKYNGQKVYKILRENRTENWRQRNISYMAKHFDQPTERWSF